MYAAGEWVEQMRWARTVLFCQFCISLGLTVGSHVGRNEEPLLVDFYNFVGGTKTNLSSTKTLCTHVSQ